jgi:hypothetical protein
LHFATASIATAAAPASPARKQEFDVKSRFAAVNGTKLHYLVESVFSFVEEGTFQRTRRAALSAERR